jgi:SAM-dependent methyltransferase
LIYKTDKFFNNNIMERKKVYKNIENINLAMAKVGCSSHTSKNYQNDVLELILAGENIAGDVIEVGCYLGGLTAILAHATEIIGKKLYVVDISAEYVAIAKKEIEKNGLGTNIIFHVGDLADFLRYQRFSDPLYACIIDGDHHYKGVVADIRTILDKIPETKNVVFHDYSLRYTEQSGLSDVRVDKAIHDTFPSSTTISFIGEKAGEGQVLRIIPSADGHYHEKGKYEGALVKLKRQI